MAFLANKIRIDAKQEQGDGTGPTELLKEFKRCNTPESRTELLTQWGLGEDTDAKANLAEYEDMDALLHSLGKGELEEMLISKKLPDTFRRIFLGSLRHAVGSKDGNDAHVDKELSDLVGKAKKFDDLESVLQSAQKYGQQFAAVVAGSGSPQALKALGMLIGMAMMASGKFDSAALTRNAAKLRSVISTVSLAGSIIGVGLGYGYHKPIALKNDQRARNEGRTTHPNNGVLNQGRFDYLGTINWSRLFGRLTDFKALSGKKLQASKARIAVDGPSLWDATKEQIWATGMNSKSFASKWFKFFGVQPGQLIDADQMTRWLGTIKAADEAPRETVDAESQPADEAAETVIPMPPGSEDEPAFLTRRSWKSNRYAKPPVSATTHVAVPSVIASQPDGIPAARPEDTRVRTERHEPNNAWSGIGPGQVPQLRCSSEQLFDAEGNLVGYGYRLVPDTSNEEPMGDLGLSHHILAVTPPVKGCFYREYQQGNYCGLHVLNMINMAVTQDFGLLMSPAQAAGRLAKANSLGETSEFSAATLVELNATNKDKVPQLTHLQCTEQHIAVAISGDQASDNVERTFAESHLAGITFRHKMAGDVETRGHTVLLVKGANGVFTIVDPKSVGLETMTSQARNMREAAFTYFRAHALCDTEENKTFDVFFPSEGEAPALSDTSSEESTVRLEKTSSEQSGSEASTEDANTSGETSSSD
jgi:hypothetical protein